MTIKKGIRIAMFLALTLLCSDCVKEEKNIFGSISGVVKDAQQQPIEGVSVSINPGGAIKTTGKDGAYSFAGLESKEYSLTYNKDEYLPTSKTTTVQAAMNNVIDVTLEKEKLIPVLAVSTKALDFGPDKTTLSLEISNTGKAALNWKIDYSPSWFTCSPSIGTVAAGGKSLVVITASRSQKEKGPYNGAFYISSDGGNCNVAVAMTVGGVGLSITQASLDFGSIATERQLTLTNTGATAIDYTVEASNSWIILPKTSGKLTATATDNLTVMVNRESLSAGDYTDGSVTIHAGAEDFITPVRMSVPANDKPTVSMEPPRDITATGATFRGAILSVGKDRVTSHGFCWSTSPNPTISNSSSNLGDCATPKSFESEVTELESGTTYYVKAYAQNSLGIAYSSERSFQTPSTVLVTGVSLNQSTLNKTAGDPAVTLTATVIPNNATNQNVSWSSSNSSVATVSNGVVNFVGAGSAEITVTTADGNKTATCNVTVTGTTVPVTSVSIDQTSLNQKVGDAPVTLTATISPSNASNKNVSWSTDNPSVATVYNGTVSFVGAGSTNITVTTHDGNKTATCYVTVTATSSGIGGTTGPLTWSLNGSVLTISGSGKMPSYGFSYSGGVPSHDSAFSPWYDYRDNITTVNILYEVTSIGWGAFSDCSRLISITIPNSITSIGLGAFESCTSLASITIPNSVTTIRDHAFIGCTSLASITIPNSVTNIGSNAFQDCSRLTSITIPNSVTTIGWRAFSGCSSLTSITIPNSVTTISVEAFYHCTSLTSITIPNSVRTIGTFAFAGCSSLTSITIPNSVTTIGDRVFSDCTSLTSITIPNAVTTIGGWAFNGCSSLTSITIPNSVTTIGSSAFYGCSSLTSITIPNSVTTIGNHVFSDCSSLRNVTVLRTSPPSITSGTTYDGTFYNVPLSSATLTVPQGSKPAYEAADGWKDFGTIVEATL
jgi:uncharacterized protein YjdB